MKKIVITVDKDKLLSEVEYNKNVFGLSDKAAKAKASKDGTCFKKEHVDD